MRAAFTRGFLLAAAYALWAVLPARAADAWGAFDLLGAHVAPGERRELELTLGETLAGTPLVTRVSVLHGVRAGPSLCLIAGIHGDELNGIESVRRALDGHHPATLAGTLIGVPVVNLLAFHNGSRYLPDRRDLNRFFPGHAHASVPHRIARRLFDGVIAHCTRVIDFHTGSARRANLAQIRGNYARPEVLAFARLFAPLSALHKPRERGTLRNAATAIGIPTVTFEAGAPGSLQEDAIAAGTAAIERVMARLDMLAHAPEADHAEQAFFVRSRWLRAPRGGLLLSDVTTGTWVEAGSEIGRVVNPLTNATTVLRTPHSGRVLGRALNQLVLPGLATFNIGILGDAFHEARASTAGHGGARPVVAE